MKKITALFISSILASCANLPAEYNVVKKTDRKTTMTLNQLRIGITEEKLGDEKYRITAKLDAMSTPQRARTMSIYHAALIAQEHNYSGFNIVNQTKANWCQTARARDSKMIRQVSGGVAHKLIVQLSNNTSNKSYRDADKVLARIQDSLDKHPNQEQLEFIERERIEFCTAKARKNTGKRMLN